MTGIDYNCVSPTTLVTNFKYGAVSRDGEPELFGIYSMESDKDDIRRAVDQHRRR